MYYIVSFKKTDEVAVVPDNWMVEDNYCKWPVNTNDEIISQMVKKKASPQADWISWEINVIKAFSKCNIMYILTYIKKAVLSNINVLNN